MMQSRSKCAFALFIVCASCAAGPQVSSKTDIAGSGWVVLYDDKGFKDRTLRIELGDNIANFANFSDKASSVRWNIPDGWMCVLYDDKDFKDTRWELKGTGATEENADLGGFSDKASSCRWEPR